MEFASQRQAFTTIYVFSFDLYGNSPRIAGIGSHIRSVHQISKSSRAWEVVGLGLEPICPADQFVYCLCGAAHPTPPHPRPEITELRHRLCRPRGCGGPPGMRSAARTSSHQPPLAFSLQSPFYLLLPSISPISELMAYWKRATEY